MSTNTKVELVALWALLLIAYKLKIPSVRIFLDSHVVIDSLNEKATLNVSRLDHWCRRIRDISKNFTTINASHILRQFNSCADTLSKRALRSETHILFYVEYRHSVEKDKGVFEGFLIFCIILSTLVFFFLIFFIC